MKQTFILLLFLIAMFSFANASIYQHYIFSTQNGTYAEITGTNITTILSDDALSEPVPIGFTFNYGLEAYTQVKVSSNGWIGLGTMAEDSNLFNELSELTSFPVIAPLWDDMSLDGGGCMYLTSGTAPNRIFTVQFQNSRWNYGANNQFNYQVLFYESGKIEFKYGNSTGTPVNASASIGININPGGVENFYSVTPGTPATASFSTENNSISSFPGNGVMYIFDPVVPVPNDLAAQSLSGNLTPTQGTQSNYTVTVRNMGTASQSTYSVQLLTGTTILASVPGTTLAAGATQQFSIPWTPQATGQLIIYGKVVLAGDAYSQNDSTQPLTVSVQAPGTIVVTIGNGDEPGRVPVDMYWKNSLFETIYPAGEITAGGLITAISFYNNFVTNLPQMPTKIWLGLSAQADLSAGWIPATELTQVFDGNVNYPLGQNVINIPLTVPFVYGGGNLVMMVNRPMDTQYYSFDDVFACQTIGTSRSIAVFDDWEAFNPASPPANPTPTGLFPKTSFYITATGPNPQFGIAPASKNYGTVLMNTINNQGFTVFNSGGGTLSVSSISLSGSPYFSLQNLPTLPVSLATGQTSTFIARYNPNAAGVHNATITLVDNITRTQHTVSLTGTCLDPTIYTSPYFQNFDGATVPSLPIDWKKLISPNAETGTIVTTSNTSYSNPNCVQLNNQTPQDGDLILISPPIANTLNLNTMRVKFRAFGGTGSSLEVGIIADITDAATFISTTTVTMNQNWNEFIVGFQAYAGTGRYIAFRHAGTGWFETICIDDVTIETIPQNDLAAVSITGNNVPSVGIQSTYTVNIYNWGTNPQSNYLVKLYQTGNIELASTTGVLVNPDQSAVVTINWTPSTAGNTQIFAKVILAADQNNLNDQTPPMNVLIQASGTSAVTIGAGDQLANIPVNMYWKNSLFETIYRAEDITAGGLITGIAFYNHFQTQLMQKPTKIWMGLTTDEELTQGWIPSTQLTLVFDGLVDYPSGSNMIIIPFSTPFAYGGTNLVMMVNRPMDTAFFSSLDQFASQTGNGNRSIHVYSDTTPFDPANPPTDDGILTGMYPKTTLFFTPSGPNPMFGVAPQSKNFGNVLLNSTNNQTFTIFNSGGAPFTVNSISLTGSPMFSLLNMPNLPFSVNSGQNTTFVVRYLPTAAGNHTASISITDNLARSRTVHTVNLTGNCIDPTIYTSPYLQNFDSATTPALPLDWQRLYSATPLDGYINTQSFSSHSTPNGIQMFNGQDSQTDFILIAPPLVNTLNITTMRVKFWSRGQNNASLLVGVISNVTDPTTFTQISSINLSDSWTEQVVSFQTYTGTGQHIAFKHGQSGTWQNIFIDDVTIETTPQNDLAAISITGNSTPSVGMASNYTVNVFNWGMNPQATYLVKLFKEGNIELASVPGQAVAPGTTAQTIVSWMPAVQENTFIYAKIVLASDQNALNDQSPNLNVYVQPAGTMVLTIGDGSETARVPMDMYYQNSLFETLYYASELNTLGMITGITFYNSFVTDLPNMPTNIWMGTTALTSLENNWIPSTSLTQVFTGNINYPAGTNAISITFANPFLYLEGNLVLMVERPMDTQWYSSDNVFYAQTIGTNRSRNVASDFDDYDPAEPPTEFVTANGLFPKTSFMIIPGGVGHITGTVLGNGNLPLNNATIQIANGANTTTNAQGQYTFQNLISGTYHLTVSRHGYINQTANVFVPEDSTVTQNFTLVQMPTVNLTGSVAGSDAPTVGLAGATISITGYENYTATTNAQGVFNISGVYTNQTYQYQIVATGHQVYTGQVTIGTVNHNMGVIIVNEIAYSARNVTATLSTDHQSVALQWLAPDPNAIDVDQSFEGTTFPPADWTRTVTNNGPANANGVYPTWCRFGAVTSGTTTIAPVDGNWQCGFWWDYNHQDEWLISPQFNCPQNAVLSFNTYAFFGSVNGDHYYVKISNNNGNTWDVLWDASTLTGGWSSYQTPVMINLAAYTGQQVKIAWHAEDPITNDGMWYNWFIDNVTVSNTITAMRFPDSALTRKSAQGKEDKVVTITTSKPITRATDPLSMAYTKIKQPVAIDPGYRNRTRSLVGYKVWRLVQGQENNESSWTQITPQVITVTDFTDAGYGALPNAMYKWAVRAIYTGNVQSLAVFSNSIVHADVTGTLMGVVRNSSNVPISGAVISINGNQIATTNTSGIYTATVNIGSYTVTCTAAHYYPQTTENITVLENQTTTLNFNMGTGTEPEIEVLYTVLNGNYPNPFNPTTTISFDVKTKSPVRIDIYNLKGQLIRTLTNEVINKGRHQVIWNGKDNHGNNVASGVYYYRMQTDNYKAIRRMMLMK